MRHLFKHTRQLCPKLDIRIYEYMLTFK